MASFAARARSAARELDRGVMQSRPQPRSPEIRRDRASAVARTASPTPAHGERRRLSDVIRVCASEPRPARVPLNYQPSGSAASASFPMDRVEANRAARNGTRHHRDSERDRRWSVIARYMWHEIASSNGAEPGGIALPSRPSDPPTGSPADRLCRSAGHEKAATQQPMPTAYDVQSMPSPAFRRSRSGGSAPVNRGHDSGETKGRMNGNR